MDLRFRLVAICLYGCGWINMGPEGAPALALRKRDGRNAWFEQLLLRCHKVTSGVSRARLYSTRGWELLFLSLTLTH